MKFFWLQRSQDVSGTSGTGLVAEGVLFSNGWCALHWLTQYTSMAYYQSIEELEAIHGHNGATKIAWDNPENNAKLASLIEDLVKKGSEIKDEFAKAYLASIFPSNGLSLEETIQSIELVERRHNFEISHYFRMKK